MKKPHSRLAAILFLVTAPLCAVAFLGPALAANPCSRAKFETALVGDACKAGGQDAARKAMKAFVKEKKAANPDLKCETCHKEIGNGFPLEADGLKKFRELGGK